MADVTKDQQATLDTESIRARCEQIERGHNCLYFGSHAAKVCKKKPCENAWAARQIPALLAEVERLRATIERVEALCDDAYAMDGIDGSLCLEAADVRAALKGNDA